MSNEEDERYLELGEGEVSETVGRLVGPGAERGEHGEKEGEWREVVEGWTLFVRFVLRVVVVVCSIAVVDCGADAAVVVVITVDAG
eukprot:scaffold15335_cov234-Alexandrium_tamarense.AAC.7